MILGRIDCVRVKAFFHRGFCWTDIESTVTCKLSKDNARCDRTQRVVEAIGVVCTTLRIARVERQEKSESRRAEESLESRCINAGYDLGGKDLSTAEPLRHSQVSRSPFRYPIDRRSESHARLNTSSQR